MLQDHKNVADGNLLMEVHMLLARFDRLYGEMVDHVDASISQSTSFANPPQFRMSFGYYDHQKLCICKPSQIGLFRTLNQ
jgi:hypothetical protein